LEKKIKKNRQVGVIHNVNLNDHILQPFLQLINHEGINLGKVSREEALIMAQKSNLDLVIVLDENSEGLPVAKIMNYSKKLYEDKKKHNVVKKKVSETKTKEIRISLKIGKHDLECKIEQSVKLMLAGCRVKLVLIMKGRERSLRDTLGMTVMNQATDLLIEIVHKHSSKNVAFEQDSDSGNVICRTFFFKK
jgi:translation initiation factor IF-3